MSAGGDDRAAAADPVACNVARPAPGKFMDEGSSQKHI
jgi:hypothetical protein